MSSHEYPEHRGFGYFRFEYQETGAALVYVPFIGTTEGGATSGGFVSVDLPYGGRVLKIVLNQNSGTLFGATTIGVHLGAAGAHPGAASETQSVTVAALDTPYTATFSSLTTFTAGSRLSVSVDPTTSSAGGFVQGIVVVEFEGAA